MNMKLSLTWGFDIFPESVSVFGQRDQHPQGR